EGIDRRRRRLADGGRVGRAVVLGLPDPAHALGHGPRREAGRRSRQPRGGSRRPLRRAPRAARDVGRRRGGRSVGLPGVLVMNLSRRGRASWLSVVVASALLAACSGGARRSPRADTAAAVEPATSTATSGPGQVSLSDADLAPMDAFIRRRFWILGDDVEIVA